MGRPTKRTPEREQRLLSALRDGNTRQASCAYAGISEHTLARWLERYGDFAEAVKKGEAAAEMRHVATIALAAHDGVWTASAWWLERRRNQQWGKIDRVEVTVRQQAERLAAELGLDAAELLAEAERIVAGAGARG